MTGVAGERQRVHANCHAPPRRVCTLVTAWRRDDVVTAVCQAGLCCGHEAASPQARKARGFDDVGWDRSKALTETVRIRQAARLPEFRANP